MINSKLSIIITVLLVGFFLDTIMGSNHFIRRSIVKFFICEQFLLGILHVTQLHAKQNQKKNARLFHIREDQLLSNWF